MNFTETDILTESQKREIIELWNKEYPEAVSLSGLAAFDEYLETLYDKNHIVLSDEKGVIKGWLVYFIRDDERWFAMLLDSSLQGRGWGSKFLNLAKEKNAALNGWVIDNDNQPKQNGENYKSPVEFYRKNGFEIRTDIPLRKNNVNGVKVVWKTK